MSKPIARKETLDSSLQRALKAIQEKPAEKRDYAHFRARHDRWKSKASQRIRIKPIPGATKTTPALRNANTKAKNETKKTVTFEKTVSFKQTPKRTSLQRALLRECQDERKVQKQPLRNLTMRMKTNPALRLRVKRNKRNRIAANEAIRKRVQENKKNETRAPIVPVKPIEPVLNTSLQRALWREQNGYQGPIRLIQNLTVRMKTNPALRLRVETNKRNRIAANESIQINENEKENKNKNKNEIENENKMNEICVPAEPIEPIESAESNSIGRNMFLIFVAAISLCHAFGIRGREIYSFVRQRNIPETIRSLEISSFVRQVNIPETMRSLEFNIPEAIRNLVPELIGLGREIYAFLRQFNLSGDLNRNAMILLTIYFLTQA